MGKKGPLVITRDDMAIRNPIQRELKTSGAFKRRVWRNRKTADPKYKKTETEDET